MSFSVTATRGLAGRLRPMLAAAGFLLSFGLFAAPVAATEVKSVTSPGGITAWLVSDDSVPLVAMNFAFRGGASQDPADKPGVGNFLTSMLDEGAGDMDSPTFQRALEENAVRLSFDVDRDAFSGSLGVPADRAGEAFRLLGLALSKPRFDADPLDRMKNQMVGRARSMATDPEVIASLAFASAAYPDHPYGRSSEGTPESLAAVTREDLVSFRDRNFARDNLIVGVVGAITAEELGPMLDAAFGALPAKASLVAVPEVAPKLGQRIEETLETPQTVIRMGTSGIKRADPDFMAAFIIDHILGGGSFSSRLYNEVREKRGLAYSVWSGLVTFDASALFLTGTATSADRTEEVISIMRSEIERMAKEGPTEKELADAKRYLTGNYALRFDSSGKISQQLVGLQMQRLPIDYFDKRNGLVEAVTLEDVKRVANRLLSGPLTVITVGPSSS